MTYYQLAFLGTPPAPIEAQLTAKLSAAIALLGMRLGDEVSLHSGKGAFTPVQKLTAAAVYFGASGEAEHVGLADLLKNGVPIIPVASKPENFKEEIPESLRALNGITLEGTSIDRLATILLECAGLLPRQRRVFVGRSRYAEEADSARTIQNVTSPLTRGFVS